MVLVKHKENIIRESELGNVRNIIYLPSRAYRLPTKTSNFDIGVMKTRNRHEPIIIFMRYF